MARDEWDPRNGRNGRTWRRLVLEVCPPGSVCALCLGAEGPIRFDLRARHPLGPSVDHITALIDGGHPTARWNLQPAHLRCNVRKENARRRRTQAPRRRSRTFPRADLL